MKLIANIGTTVGTEHGSQAELSQADIERATAKAFSRLGMPHTTSVRMSNGGDWAPEPVVVVTVDIDPDSEQLAGLMSCILELVSTAGQDCIALQDVKHHNGGTMVFHPAYHGERYLFNADYFTPAN